MIKKFSKVVITIAVSSITACAPNGATPTKKPTIIVSQLNSGQEYVHRGYIIPRMDPVNFSAGVELVADSDPTNICRSESDLVTVERNVGYGVIVCPSIGVRTEVRPTPYPSNSGTMAASLTDATGAIIGRYSMAWGPNASEELARQGL